MENVTAGYGFGTGRARPRGQLATRVTSAIGSRVPLAAVRELEFPGRPGLGAGPMVAEPG